MKKQVNIFFTDDSLEGMSPRIKSLRAKLRRAAKQCYELKSQEKTPESVRLLELWERRELSLIKKLELAELQEL